MNPAQVQLAVGAKVSIKHEGVLDGGEGEVEVARPGALHIHAFEFAGLKRGRLKNPAMPECDRHWNMKAGHVERLYDARADYVDARGVQQLFRVLGRAEPSDHFRADLAIFSPGFEGGGGASG